MYGTNLDQVGPNMAKLDLLGQVGRHFAVFCLLRKAPLTNLDQVGPVLFPAVFRALLKNVSTSDFQSEVGEVFGEIGGELPAKFGR